MRHAVLASLFALTTLGITTEAMAVPGGRTRGTTTTAAPAASSGARSHRGFMARLSVGFGYLGMSETVAGLSFGVSGFAGAAHFAVGGNVIPNLAVHGTFWSSLAFNPSTSISAGGGTFAGSASSNTSLTQSALGVGVTYALSEIDLFFTGSLGVGFLSATSYRSSVTVSTNASAGFAFNLGVGKHWAVSPDWGLGLMGQFNFQTNTDNVGASGYAISTVGAALFFSAAYH